MTDSFAPLRELRELPKFDRPEALEQIVVREFKKALLMTEDEDFPLSESFFDMGFTSLRVTEVKQRLEELLECSISSNVLFNNPTAELLVSYLMTEVLTDLFPEASDARR
ncbi:acyl carrier protein [Streptomyces sp. NPDC019990]|uniref:acyl carrier protein n=1 Tax=Streptomyces sp. NPDC019990 TaxID=3154693 RepID=UPI0033EB3E9B